MLARHEALPANPQYYHKHRQPQWRINITTGALFQILTPFTAATRQSCHLILQNQNEPAPLPTATAYLLFCPINITNALSNYEMPA